MVSFTNGWMVTIVLCYGVVKALKVLDEKGQAKADKDWATSDKIRNELISYGFTIKDTKDGSEWSLN